MKKTFRLVGMAVMAIFMALSFSACSDDDDDKDGKGGDSALIGTWYMWDDGCYDEFNFKKDGTYKHTHSHPYDDDDDDYYDSGTWSTSKDVLKVHTTYDSDEGKINWNHNYYYEVDGDELYLTYFDEDGEEDTEVLYRK